MKIMAKRRIHLFRQLDTKRKPDDVVGYCLLSILMAVLAFCFCYEITMEEQKKTFVFNSAVMLQFFLFVLLMIGSLITMSKFILYWESDTEDKIRNTDRGRCPNAGERNTTVTTRPKTKSSSTTTTSASGASSQKRISVNKPNGRNPPNNTPVSHTSEQPQDVTSSKQDTQAAPPPSKEHPVDSSLKKLHSDPLSEDHQSHSTQQEIKEVAVTVQFKEEAGSEDENFPIMHKSRSSSLRCSTSDSDFEILTAETFEAATAETALCGQFALPPHKRN